MINNFQCDFFENLEEKNFITFDFLFSQKEINLTFYKLNKKIYFNITNLCMKFEKSTNDWIFFSKENIKNLFEKNNNISLKKNENDEIYEKIEIFLVFMIWLFDDVYPFLKTNVLIFEIFKNIYKKNNEKESFSDIIVKNLFDKISPGLNANNPDISIIKNKIEKINEDAVIIKEKLIKQENQNNSMKSQEILHTLKLAFDSLDKKIDRLIDIMKNMNNSVDLVL